MANSCQVPAKPQCNEIAEKMIFAKSQCYGNLTFANDYSTIILKSCNSTYHYYVVKNIS